MKRIVQTAALIAVGLCVLSCTRNQVKTSEAGDLTISLTPTFNSVYGASAPQQHGATNPSFGVADTPDGLLSERNQFQNLHTRASATAFDVGDALGLFVVADGRDLTNRGNLADNSRMEVLSDNTLGGKPDKVYYPSATSVVSLYSYYPYDAMVSDPLSHLFAVKTDQSVYAAYLGSDFCYGRRLSVSASTSAQAITFEHKMSQLLINVTVPKILGGKSVARVASVEVIGVDHCARVNLETGAISALADKASTIILLRDAAVSDNTTSSTTRFAGLLPAQTVASRAISGEGFARITVEFSDASVFQFIYNSDVSLTFAAASANTFSLAVVEGHGGGSGGGGESDNCGVVLKGDPSITAWTEVSQSAIVKETVSNRFTAIWMLPINNYATVDGVVLGVRNSITGVLSRFAMSNVLLRGDHSSDQAVFTFDFAPTASDDISYPYVIDYVEFRSGVNVIRQCASMVAANVTRTGSYTLGIDQENLIAISIGSISDWDELLYGDITRGVDNDFRLQLIEYVYFADLATVKLRIDGDVFTFNGVSCSVGSNKLVATTGSFRFPDANGRAPYKYPFTIENVSLFNASGGLLTDGVYPSSIMVNRAGMTTLRMYKGMVSALAATVVGYNSSSSAGRPDYSGGVNSNPIRVVYCAGGATAATSCRSIDRVVLTVNGQEVLLSGYSAVMSGSVFAAQSGAPHVDITAGVGVLPTNYPYVISAVKFQKFDGTVLFSSALSTALRVDWWGEVTIEVMEKMAN